VKGVFFIAIFFVGGKNRGLGMGGKKIKATTKNVIAFKAIELAYLLIT
jgi:hypothetical protein